MSRKPTPGLQQPQLFSEGAPVDPMTDETLTAITERIGDAADLTPGDERVVARVPSEAAIDQGWGSHPRTEPVRPDWQITPEERSAFEEGDALARAALKAAAARLDERLKKSK